LLSEGHARALVKLVDSPAELQDLRDSIIKNNLSVRQTERAIKKAISVSQAKRKRETPAEELPPSYRKALITQLTNRLNSKVTIQQNGTRGKIEIEYYSLDDLDRVTSLLLPE
jgi:ParB family chromosome partitioning protein